MGKGDKRSRRGKIWRKSYGKARPNPRKLRLKWKAATAATATSETS